MQEKKIKNGLQHSSFAQPCTRYACAHYGCALFTVPPRHAFLSQEIEAERLGGGQQLWRKPIRETPPAPFSLLHSTSHTTDGRPVSCLFDTPPSPLVRSALLHPPSRSLHPRWPSSVSLTLQALWPPPHALLTVTHSEILGHWPWPLWLSRHWKGMGVGVGGGSSSWGGQ